MHELIEKMHAAHEAATRNLHVQMSSHMETSRQKASELNAQRALHVDPMNAMEEELKRIQVLLSHQVVRPDIQGWAPAAASGGSPPRFIGSASMGSPSALRGRVV